MAGYTVHIYKNNHKMLRLVFVSLIPTCKYLIKTNIIQMPGTLTCWKMWNTKYIRTFFWSHWCLKWFVSQKWSMFLDKHFKVLWSLNHFCHSEVHYWGPNNDPFKIQLSVLRRRLAYKKTTSVVFEVHPRIVRSYLKVLVWPQVCIPRKQESS